MSSTRVLMGDYSQKTPVETLMVNRAVGVPNDLAMLRGVRFVSAVKAEAGQRLAESLVKQLTSRQIRRLGIVILRANRYHMNRLK